MKLGSEKHHTVFEGEGVGLILGMELIREEMADGMVTIGIDNITAIATTHAIKPGPSQYIWDIFHWRVAMTYNHKGLDILVKWTPGHMGIEGNEAADGEAKKAAKEGLSPTNKLPVPLRKLLPWSKSTVRQEFMRKLNLAAKKLWSESPRFYRIACIDVDFKHNSFTKLSYNLQPAFCFNSGWGMFHLTCTFMYLHKIQKTDLPICPSCLQHSKTVMHYILHCPKYTAARRHMFHEAGRDMRDIGKLLSTAELLPHLFCYIKSTGRFRL